MRTRLLFIGLVVMIAGLHAEVIDSFGDGDFTANPVWQGDVNDWVVESNAVSATNVSNSYTLRLDAQAAASGVKWISAQRTATWGAEQSWGFWIGRTSDQAATTTNQSIIWLWASESDLESATVDGYRVLIGDNSGDDEFHLQRVDNGVATTILSSASGVPNGLEDIGILVRVTKSGTSEWQLFTSDLSTANGEGASAMMIPSADNTSNSQGTATDATYTNFTDGYIGVMAVHTSSSGARKGAEFDQFYFEPDADATLPVQLSSFSAQRHESGVLLRWETQSELNNNGFRILRSVEKDGTYSVISPLIPGAGTSTTVHRYSFLDRRIQDDQVYWYQLQQIDLDGVTTTFGPIESKLQHGEASLQQAPQGFRVSSIYPNPFNPSTRIQFEIAKERVISLDVYDMQGRFVRQLLNESRPSGEYLISWDGRDRFGSPVSSGMYICRLMTDQGEMSAAKVLKVH